MEPSANLVAEATSSGRPPGRKPAALRTSFAAESMRGSVLKFFGAVTSSALSRLAAWARAFTAEQLAARKTRIISTVPSVSLAQPMAVPAQSVALAAGSVPMGSDLPERCSSRLFD